MKLSRFLLAAIALAFLSWSCSSDIVEEEDGKKITIKIDTDSEEVKADIEEGVEDLQEGLEDMTEGLNEGLEDMTIGLSEGLAEMTAGLSEALSNITIEVDGEQVEAADFRDLKAILPERMLRMQREEFSGERSGLKGIQFSEAHAEYEDDDRHLEISIIDGGGFPIARFAKAGWSMIEVDKEDRHGYERTTTIDGHKAFEKYNSKWEEGELALIYQDRFIIAIKGKGISESDLRKALKKLDLDELDDL